MITPPVGRWWLAYPDGTVWPCEVVHATGWPGVWTVRPIHPAPDAGVERGAPTRAIYDSAFNHPKVVA